MAVQSRGRGTVAALGLFLLFAGLVGGGVLYIVAQRRPAQTVEGFARAVGFYIQVIKNTNEP